MFQTDQRIGPYTLIRKLGVGGFGEVWLAERNDVMAAPKVALKMPLDNEADLNTLGREARLWVDATGHPNVLPVIEFNTYDGQVVIVSEYVAGGTLSNWLLKFGGKAPSVERAVEIIAGILAGLQHLHTLDPSPIVHCDLKPDNIMMQSEIPRLTDFGISRVSKTTAFTRQFTGTLAYMSPEAFKGGYPPQRDLWAVGVILYHMLTGRLPFPQDDAPQVMAAILTEEPPELPVTFPLHVRKAVMKALCKDPTQRFGSAAEMRTALLKTSFARPEKLPSQKHTVAGPLPALPSEKQTVAGPLPGLPSERQTVIPAVPAPSSQQLTVGSAVGLLAVPASEFSPGVVSAATDQEVMDARASQLKRIRVRQAKERTQRKTLALVAGAAALAAGVVAFMMTRSNPASPAANQAVVSIQPRANVPGKEGVVPPGTAAQRTLETSPEASSSVDEARSQGQIPAQVRQGNTNRRLGSGAGRRSGGVAGPSGSDQTSAADALPPGDLLAGSGGQSNRGRSSVTSGQPAVRRVNGGVRGFGGQPAGFGGGGYNSIRSRSGTFGGRPGTFGGRPGTFGGSSSGFGGQ